MTFDCLSIPLTSRVFFVLASPLMISVEAAISIAPNAALVRLREVAEDATEKALVPIVRRAALSTMDPNFIPLMLFY